MGQTSNDMYQLNEPKAEPRTAKYILQFESNALNNGKLMIFKINDERVLFYFNNLDLLPPKPKLSFRYLKQGIQEFHRKYVLAPSDKALIMLLCDDFIISIL